MDNKEKKAPSPPTTSRLQRVLKSTEDNRLERVNQVKAKTGRVDIPLEQRKLTQQEAAAYCGVSTATIYRWTKEGLKAIPYGKRYRYLVVDLQDFMKNGRKR